ncbi:hypothetical protein D2E60_21595 [Mycobacteroides abscessus]|nr:hypothetical protein D2E60_21595 [Mycobacteroides abscessus]
MPLRTRSPTYAFGNLSRGGRAMRLFYASGLTLSAGAAWFQMRSGRAVQVSTRLPYATRTGVSAPQRRPV